MAMKPVPAIGVLAGSLMSEYINEKYLHYIAGTGFNRPGTFNAIARVSGNVLSIPVELTGFEIVDE